MNTTQISWHITGNHPVRECFLIDREGEAVCIVRLPRGFETLNIAVFGDGLTEADCRQSALEWLAKHHPLALTAEETQEAGL